MYTVQEQKDVDLDVQKENSLFYTANSMPSETLPV